MRAPQPVSKAGLAAVAFIWLAALALAVKYFQLA